MIAHLLAPGAIGGVETVVGELLDAAAGSGVPSTALALLLPGTPLPGALAGASERGADIRTLPAPHRRYLAHLRDVRAALRQSGATVVHTHGYHADVIGGVAARLLRLPHIATLHGFVGGSQRGHLYERLQLLALRRADAVIAVSASVRDRAHAAGIAGERLHVIANAAPVSDALPRDEARRLLGLEDLHDRPVIGWVGRFSEEKHPLGFVELCASLVSTEEAAPLGVIVGDGPEMARVREAAAPLEASGHFRVTGAVRDAGRLLSAFDCLVLTSRTEGTPMVALEAMRAGVPVVSTAVGGVPALLGAGAGVLVDPDDADGLRRAVARVLEDTPFRDAMIDAAHRTIEERFDRATWWSAHQSLYAALAR